GKVHANQLRANYRQDTWFIKEFEVDLTGLPRELIVNKLDSCLTFEVNRAKYPAAVEKILSQINPVGPWFVVAKDVRVPLAAPEKADYHALLYTHNGQLWLNDRRIPVFNIDTSISAVPGIVRIEHLDAVALQGEIHAT